LTKVQTEYGDFGFSFHSEDDITKEIALIGDQNTVEWLERAMKLKDMILPLLHNLAKDPEREYIKWPNRGEAINKFITKMFEVIDLTPSEDDLV